MPPKHPPKPPVSTPANPKKRKNGPHTNNANAHKKAKPNDHRTRQRDARHLPTQLARKAFPNNGALDVDKFVKARDYEIQALEQGIRQSKGALNRRAFQQVPKDLRRRGAAHDVKKVVKRLRGRAAREMAEDGAVKEGKVGKKKGRVGWLRKEGRMETVKMLRAAGESRRKRNGEVKGGKGEVAEAKGKTKDQAIPTRPAKVKKAILANPPTPKAKFRKRQQHKSWLPTHLFHTKRAHMTPPSAPMWRFALPLSPTQKSYRPTHRASSERGAERSVLGLLRALGVEESWLTGVKGRKWRVGTRVLDVLVHEREEPKKPIGPVTIVWCTAQPGEKEQEVQERKTRRKLFLRVHPSAFLELWEEVERLAKVAKPNIKVEDLRWELGSIELKGPGSTEALLGALWPSQSDDEGGVHAAGSAEKTWTSLTGLTNAAMLPSGAMLAFSVQDPKLHFPPRTIKVPDEGDSQTQLFETIANWPVDSSQQPAAIFNHKDRQLGSKLPSQKAVNRRKTLARPGQYPESRPGDPRIPVLLYVSGSNNSKQHQQTSWHLLAPWKAIQPIWYSLIYCPLSTGHQPRFGGVDEQRQLAFEAGTPWFPGDFPGTKAGWDMEVLQRRKRWDEWRRKPRGKRVAWESVQWGQGRGGRGEVGEGWTCGWEVLLRNAAEQDADDSADNETTTEKQAGDAGETPEAKRAAKNNPSFPEPPTRPTELAHISSTTALAILANPSAPLSFSLTGKLITIRLTLLTRGTPQPCARIYRLPSATTHPKLRAAWLALHPRNLRSHKEQKKYALPRVDKTAPPHVQQQRLAASLLEPPTPGCDDYPACPGKEDLVGFVTSAGFNLAEGKGTGLGCMMLERVFEDVRVSEEERRLCVVRNAGEGLARLGAWEVV